MMTNDSTGTGLPENGQGRVYQYFYQGQPVEGYSELYIDEVLVMQVPLATDQGGPDGLGLLLGFDPVDKGAEIEICTLWDPFGAGLTRTCYDVDEDLEELDAGWGSVHGFSAYYVNSDGTQDLVAQVGYIFILDPQVVELSVSAAPDTIATGGTSAVRVAPIDIDGDMPLIPDVTTIDLYLDDAGAALGRLSWRTVSGSSLLGVPYGSIRAGEVRFVANGGVPPAVAVAADDRRKLYAEIDRLAGDPDSPPLTVARAAGRGEAADAPAPSASAQQADSYATVYALYSYDYDVGGSAVITVTGEDEPEYSLTLSFDKDPDTYLPLADDPIIATATVSPAPPDGSTVTFEVNSSGSTGDIVMLDEDGTTFLPLVIEVSGATASINLLSQRYWGTLSITATLDVPEGDGAEDTPTGDGAEDTRQIPEDSDGDRIADSWEMANGGLALGTTGQSDASYDGEGIATNPNTGDQFTKLDEYKGVTIDGVHKRLSPLAREAFFDVGTATEGPLARDRVASLGFTIVDFSSQSPVVFHGRHSTGGIRMIDGAFDTVSNDGLVYLNGAKQIENKALFGVAQYSPGDGSATVFLEAIDNFFNQNKFDENKKGFVRFDAPVNASSAPYVAMFDGTTDTNGGGMGFANPMDLASPRPPPSSASAVTSADVAANNPEDGVVGGVTKPAAVRIVSIHEAGHVVMLVHPGSGVSPMREGLGPASSETFTQAERDQARVK